MASKAVAKRKSAVVVTQRTREAMEVEFPELPPALLGSIDCKAWLASLLGKVPYVEPDSDFLARQIMLNTFMEEDLNKALLGSEMDSLQDLVEEFPGASTGPIDITELYVATSNLEDQDGTYVILGWTSMETGIFTRCTTSAMAIQIGLLRHLRSGIWPISCQIARDKVQDQGGRFLLKLWPVDAH